MEENKKHKTSSADDLFRIIDGLPSSQKQEELDDFEREALEGLKMVKDRGRIHRIHDRIDEQLQEKKKNRGIVFWLSAAASLVLVVGLIYLIAPQLNSKNEVSAADKQVSQAENEPASNTDYKLAETRVEEVTVSADTLQFGNKDASLAANGKVREEDEINVKNEGAGFLNMTLDNETEVVATKKDNEITQDILLEDKSKMNPGFTTVTGTGINNYDSVAVSGNVATSNMVNVNATYNSPVSVQEKQKQEREKDKIKDQKLYQQQSYGNTAYNQSNTSSAEDLSVMQPSSDSTVGFYNGIAYDNKGKKSGVKRTKKNANKSAAVQSEVQYQPPNRKAERADTAAYVSGSTLREIVLSESLKKTEYEEKANLGDTENGLTTSTLTEFPGGFDAMQKFFRDNVKKPSAGFKGVVVASFTVNKDGTVSNPRIVSAIKDCDECSKEVLRVIRMMPKWKPATSAGKPISITYTLPVRF